MNNPPPVLDYRGAAERPPARPLPRRPWICFLSLAVLYMGNTRARMTPPGWPTPEDFLLMLFLPAAAVVMALLTSLPGWAIGFYGAIGACTFPLAQFSDTRFPLKIDSRNPWPMVAFWCTVVLAAWLFCRLSVHLRRLTGRSLAG